jgi:hypothetical protein
MTVAEISPSSASDWTAPWLSLAEATDLVPLYHPKTLLVLGLGHERALEQAVAHAEQRSQMSLGLLIVDFQSGSGRSRTSHTAPPEPTGELLANALVSLERRGIRGFPIWEPELKVAAAVRKAVDELGLDTVFVGLPSRASRNGLSRSHIARLITCAPDDVRVVLVIDRTRSDSSLAP